jgi:hypothetical protein
MSPLPVVTNASGDFRGMGSESEATTANGGGKEAMDDEGGETEGLL